VQLHHGCTDRAAKDHQLVSRIPTMCRWPLWSILRRGHTRAAHSNARTPAPTSVDAVSGMIHSAFSYDAENGPLVPKTVNEVAGDDEDLTQQNIASATHPRRVHSNSPSPSIHRHSLQRPAVRRAPGAPSLEHSPMRPRCVPGSDGTPQAASLLPSWVESATCAAKNECRRLLIVLSIGR